MPLALKIMEVAQWAIHAFSDIISIPIGDEVVVFDAGSGGTHVLDPIAAHVVDCISRHVSTGQELIEGIEQAFDMPADDALNDYLDALLRTLQRKHLIRPVDA